MGGAWNTLKTNIGLTKKEWEEKDRNTPENVAARKSLDEQKKQWAENDRKYQEQLEQKKQAGNAYGQGHSAQDEFNATQNNVKKALAESSRGPGLQNVGVTTSTQNNTSNTKLDTIAADASGKYTERQKKAAQLISGAQQADELKAWFDKLSDAEQQRILNSRFPVDDLWTYIISKRR